MKRIVKTVSATPVKAWRWIRAKRLRLVVAISAVVILGLGAPISATVLFGHGEQPSIRTEKVQATTSSDKDDHVGGEQPLSTPAATTPGAQADTSDANRASSSPSSKPSPAPTPAAAQLIIAPGHLTIEAGKSAPLSIRSTDGVALHMPMVKAPFMGPYMNTTASPARTLWNTNLGLTESAPVGTHTFTISAQRSDNKKIMQSTISVTVTAPPSFTVRATTADTEPGRQSVHVSYTRSYGVTVPVSHVSVTADAAGTSCSLDYDYENGTKYAFSCYAPDGASGNYTATVTAAGKSYSTRIPFTIPEDDWEY